MQTKGRLFNNLEASPKNILIPTVLFYLGTLIISLTTFRPFFNVFNVSDLLYILSIFTLLIVLFKKGKDPIQILIQNNYLLVPLLLFLCGAILSLINSSDLTGALITILKYIFLFGIWFPFGVYLFSDIQRIRMLICWIILASIIPIVIGISDFLFGTSISSYLNELLNLNIGSSGVLGDRFGSVMGHPNNFGILLSVVFPLSLWVIFDENSKTIRALGIIYLISIILSSLITGSRATLLSIFIQSLIFPLLLFKEKHRRIGVLGFIVLLPVLITVFSTAILDLVALNRLYQTLNFPIGEYAPDIERIASLITALDFIKNHPLIGIGVENTEALTEKLFVHNTIFRLWASIGICGLVASLWFYGIGIVLAIRLRRKCIEQDNTRNGLLLAAILTSIIGWIAIDMVQPQFHNRIKWIMYILLFSLYNTDNKKNQKKKEVR